MKAAFWIVTVVVAVGFAYVLAPDLTRYMKIRAM
jgi:hypothetical protein